MRKSRLFFWSGFIFYLFCTNFVFAGNQLVQIGVEIVEVDTSKSHQYGIKWLETVRAEESSVAGLVGISGLARVTPIYADLKLLMEKGAAELLANPKLVTRSGTTATFRAGGEIPYIISTGQGAVHIEFKSYGVNLEIKPVVESPERIELNLKAEVSAPDISNTVSLSGNTVPGLLSRILTTQLSVKPGATITIAGLNQTRKEITKSGVPLLAEIPLLGALFSHEKSVNKKTSIVIFVTPTILE